MNQKILIILGFAAFNLGLFSMTSCERIDAGHVGVKVNLYGDGKGIDDVTEVTGWVLYNPFTTKIVEFPVGYSTTLSPQKLLNFQLLSNTKNTNTTEKTIPMNLLWSTQKTDQSFMYLHY